MWRNTALLFKGKKSCLIVTGGVVWITDMIEMSSARLRHFA